MTPRTRATRESDAVPTDVPLDRIRDVTFRAKLHGYHPDDVDGFIEGVARAVETLEGRLRDATERANRSEALVARLERVLEGLEHMQSETSSAQRFGPRADRLADLEARVRAREDRIRQIIAPAGQSVEELRQALAAKRLEVAHAVGEAVSSAPEPVVAEPVVTEPVVTEPVVTEPVVTEPVETVQHVELVDPPVEVVEALEAFEPEVEPAVTNVWEPSVSFGH